MESEESIKLRKKILELTAKYFELNHLPSIKSSFEPGDSIPYAGRVFDANEMQNLVDASLDFWLSAGRFSTKFEQNFAKYLGCRFCSLVNSGSSANLLAFSALQSYKLGENQIKPGDEIITVAAGFPTTIAPIIQSQCIPVFLDITVDDGTYNIDVKQLEAALSPKTKAIVLAHTLGNPFDLSTVTKFCKENQLFLIEDNCDALGARYKEKLTGTFGDLATSSFYPPHHITMGEGGAVSSKHNKFKPIINSLRDWGRDCWCQSGKDNTCGKRFSQQFGELPHGYDHKYVYSHLGYNLKATEMQAAIGLAQLEKLPVFIEKRNNNWHTLRKLLKNLEEHFILPNPTKHSEPSWFGFLLTVKKESPLSRNKVVQYLESKKIQTRMLFAGNITKQPCMSHLIKDSERCRIPVALSNTDRVTEDTFWIGVYPGMKEGMLQYIVEAVYDCVKCFS